MESKKLLVPVILVMFIGLFIGFTIFGDNGVLHLLGMNQEIKRIENNIRNLNTKNEKLKHVALLLQHNERYQELMSRQELGMVRENEKIFIFK
ncbi:MAG: septum formation initiator family protein [Deltaproteobacteria bacterium]|nr:septum formation initiator family protein [Deltaproteobacteria bacterium]